MTTDQSIKRDAIIALIAVKLKDGEEYGENSVWLWLDDNTVSVQNQIAKSMMARFKREKLSEAAMNELVKIGQEIDKEPTDV